MAQLIGFGAYLPSAVVENRALAEEFGIEEEWIFEVCGIRTRRVAGPDESVEDLAEQAARACLADAGLKPSDLGGIIVGSGTAHRRFPGISAGLQCRLGSPGIPAFDIPLGCVGGFFAMATAAELAERYGHLLVVGAEHMSLPLAMAPRVKETAILFGDGAGACIVTRGAGPITILDARMQSDGTFANDLSLEFGSSLTMNGRAVILQANRKLSQSISDLLARNKIAVEDIGLWLFHQANLKLLRQVAHGLGIPEERIYLNLERYGNTSAASVLIAMGEAKAEGRFQPGLAVVAAFGAGMGWGSALLRFEVPPVDSMD
ncbi:MAG: ketoacyl-ACP synthase III [Holophaga sp.]|nr:ketoacyl-ACP synthase III [Holophaga sp.]